MTLQATREEILEAADLLKRTAPETAEIFRGVVANHFTEPQSREDPMHYVGTIWINGTDGRLDWSYEPVLQMARSINAAAAGVREMMA